MVRRRRYDGAPRLYGTQEAARYLGISRRNLTYLLANGKVVEPLTRLAATPVWSESQLDEQLFIWRDNPPKQMDPEQVRQMTLTRQLTALDERWEKLVEAAIDRADGRTIRAVWEGRAGLNRRKGGRSSVAGKAESRRALAEAKLLRLVAQLRDQDPVFRAIGAELDEAANLREEIQALKDARAEAAFASEAIDAHQG
jgi:hypothetical protein